MRIAAADVAAVLLRLKPAGERDLINRIKVLAPIVQGKDAALVLDGQAEIAARAGADGAHLTGHRGVHGGGRKPQAGAHRRLRRLEDPRRRDGSPANAARTT